jgi:glycerol-3-phosphate dehydrogenase (NAD(P)+)
MPEQNPAPTLAILGAGSWGTALAIVLACRFERVHLWAHHRERASAIAKLRENKFYLPGFLLPENVFVFSDIGQTVSHSHIVLSVVPSHFLRGVLTEAREHLPPSTTLVSATKGIEEGSLLRMSEVMQNALGENTSERIAVLSGPTFAKEVAAGEPAALVIASRNVAVAEEIQRAFVTPSLRLYASSDVAGVEIGAALKNVIAIGAGVCRGLGLGSNTVAAVVTRGLAEITRLAVALGGHARTLSGLAGLGDLVLTATGDLSRNRFVGIKLGEGHTLPEILSGMSMVAEGVETCRAAHWLAKRENVELPIVRTMYELLYEAKDPRKAIRELMERPLTTE